MGCANLEGIIDSFKPTTECEHVWVDASCELAKTCSICGETEGEALGHTEVLDASKAPTCTEKGLTEGKHCSVCGEIIVAQSPVDALGHKDANKDHACDNECETAQGEHADADKDHACDYGCSETIGTCADADKNHVCDYGCGKSYGEHVDANNDHACDYGCSETIGTCADADKDHACDYGCDKSYGEHVDANKDHACDYGCSETFGTCADANNDHVCDYGCGKSYGDHIDENHDHICDYGCSAFQGEHVDTNNDHVCEYGCSEAIGECADADKNHSCDHGCGKNFGDHADTNNDHVCEYGCQVAIGTCEDKDLDHACDYGCEKYYGTHTDAGLDHACDYGCQVAIGTCEDKNLDHACDYGCGKNYGEHVDSADDADHVCDYGCKAVLESCSDVLTDDDHKCDVCGAEDITTHVYGDWEVDTAPTYEAAGLEKQYCNCGHYNERTVAQLIAVESIGFERALHNLVLGVNESVTLEVTVLPENASNKTLTWTSTDDTIASVVDGVITAHKEGFVNIIATDDRGQVEKKAFIYVTSTVVDGDISDSKYVSSIPSFSERADRTQETRVVFSEGGIYLVYNVVDKNMKEDSHIEAYIALGNESKIVDQSFEVRFYPLNETLSNGAAYKWDGEAWAGITNTFRMYGKTIPVTDADGNNVGYTSETFIPYSSFGLTEAPEILRMLSVQFYWTGGEAISSGHSNEVAFKMAHLDDFTYYKSYDKNGLVGNASGSTVEVKFDNGTISNTGSSTEATVGQFTANGESGTNKKSNTFVAADSMTFTNGLGGEENGAAVTNHLKGPYTVVQGANLGTGDFTVSAWFNIPVGEAVSGGNATYLFGDSSADFKVNKGFRLTVRLVNGQYLLNCRAGGNSGVYNGNVLAMQQGEWHLLTITRKGTTVSFYFDNTLVMTQTVAENYDFGNYGIGFGGNVGDTWSYNDNEILFDNIRVYDRALSADDVTYLYYTDN